MVTFTEGRHACEGLLSEANFHRSRDNITVVSGAGILAPGTVLAKITASGKYKASTATGSDGGQTANAILLYPVDATAADVQVAAITRDAEWNVHTLSYDSTVDDDTKKAAKHVQLAAVGIIVR
ncbi:MAG: head decoration protein [Fulvimarina sp.]|nr:head decoration protein [Fulvimarina sp.]